MASLNHFIGVKEVMNSVYNDPAEKGKDKSIVIGMDTQYMSADDKIEIMIKKVDYLTVQVETVVRLLQGVELGKKVDEIVVRNRCIGETNVSLLPEDAMAAIYRIKWAYHMGWRE